jgi:hypothetical protein
MSPTEKGREQSHTLPVVADHIVPRSKTSVDTLLLLPSAVRLRTIAALSPQDARLILRNLPVGTSAADLNVALQRVWRTFESLDRELGVEGNPRQVLRLLVETASRWSQTPDTTLLSASAAIVSLAGHAEGSQTVCRAIRRTIVARNRGALDFVVPPEVASTLLPLLEADVEWVQSVFDLLESEESVKVGRESAQPDSTANLYYGYR